MRLAMGLKPRAHRSAVDVLVGASFDLDRLIARMERHGRLQRDHDDDVAEAERIALAIVAAVRGPVQRIIG